jgi:hypothetical protein
MSDFVQQPESAGQPEALSWRKPDSGPPADSSTTRSRAPLVAVVAVHGIGQHAPGSSENAMVDLLLSLPAGHPQRDRYFDSFKAVGMQIPLQPVHVATAAKSKQTIRSRVLNLYQEQSSKFARAITSPGSIHRGETGNEFSGMVLKDYLGGADGNAYCTTRLEGRRSAAAPGGATDLHVYEVLWADLASANNTALRFLLALFQLLLHLGSLSRLAVDTGSGENSGLLWQTYLALQRYAVRMLQIFIPLFKVILLIVVFSCIPGIPNRIGQIVSIAVVLCAIAGTAIGFLFLTSLAKVMRVPPWIWAAGAVVPASSVLGLDGWEPAHQVTRHMQDRLLNGFVLAFPFFGMSSANTKASARAFKSLVGSRSLSVLAPT